MGDGGHAAELNGIPSSETAATRSERRSTRACDACSSLKERCIRLHPGKNCERCKRLARPCVSNRPLKALGRKRLVPPPRSQKAIVRSLPDRPPKLPSSLDPFGALIRGLKPSEQLIAREFINPSNFTQLMVMPPVGQKMHQEAVQVFLQHHEDLSDACFSMYGAFAAAVGMPFPDYDDRASLQRANVALRKFCAMSCPESQAEFGRWLWLGLAVMIYAHTALGSPASPVRRTILSHLVAMDKRGREMRRHPLVVSFTTLDILECLFYRQRPVADLDNDDGYVTGLQSFPGLVTHFIKLVHRLCNINQVDPKSYADDSYDWPALAALQIEVEAWQPIVEPSELSALDAVTISHLLTRTRVHKTAILLYIHRIQHPFGEEDGAADSLASMILSDLDMATATTQRAPDWVTTPFILAGIEAHDAVRRCKVEADLPKYVDGISPKARAMALDFLRALWAMRDKMSALGCPFRWIDVMDDLPPLCVYI